MDISKLIHSGSRITDSLYELPNESLVTKTGCKIYIPVRFNERNLASVGIETYVIGIFAMVVDDLYYGVFLVNAMMRLDPTDTRTVSIGGDDYFEFYFEKGSTVVMSTQLVKTDTLTFRIYDELISKGRVPWYMGYAELGKVFNTAEKHAGANIGKNREVTELIVSMIARDQKDRTKYYRYTVKSLEDLRKYPPAFIPLKSVRYGATNTLNKLAGSYFQEGLVSGLVNPATRVEPIEKILT